MAGDVVDARSAETFYCEFCTGDIEDSIPPFRVDLFKSSLMKALAEIM